MKIIKYFLLVSLIIGFVSISNAQDFSELFKKGKESYNLAKFNDAKNYFSKGLSIPRLNDKKSSKLYYWYAKSMYNNSRIDYILSIKFLDSAIMLDPDYKEAYFLRARIRQFESGIDKYVIKDFKMASGLSSIFLKDIYIKCISIYYLYGKERAFKKIEGIINEKFYTNPKSTIIPKTQSGLDLLSECNYAYASIYALLNNNELALSNLNQSIIQGFNDFEFLNIDFYNLRNDDKFLSFLKGRNLDIWFQSNNNKIVFINRMITKFVENKINNWQKKGKYEKVSDYQNRVNDEARLQKIEYYTQKAIDSIGISLLRFDLITNEYDADNESFKISFPDYNPIFLKVPLNEAQSFDANFNDFEFSNIKFTLLDNYDLEIMHLEIINSTSKKTYIYDSQDIVSFSSNQFAFNFDDIKVNLNDLTQAPTKQISNQTTKIINVGKSDVDTEIPINYITNKNTFALIIGNEDYTKYQTDLNSESNVDFAKNDAEVFAKYIEKTLGVPKENITLLTDAISSQMQREIEKLSKLTKYTEGKATIIFYFAGHGFPDEITKESYIMPVDISGSDVKYGIKLNDLYAKLTEFPSEKIFVILDACFSGAGRNHSLLAARSVRIKPKVDVVSGNLLIFTSSSGVQSSLPYSNKQHGMFTYFLLKKLKETKGDITLEKLSDYVIKEVQINAIKINSKEQNPNIIVSPDVSNLWMDWKLK
jgi:hypothetical protein